MQMSHMKSDLLQQLKMNGMDDKGIKIYQTGGLKFSVSDKDLHLELPEARAQNRENLKKAVADKVNQLEQEFVDRDNKIQQIVESEEKMNSSRLKKLKTSSNLLPGGHKLVSKIETGKFIQTIHEHMDEGLATG